MQVSKKIVLVGHFGVGKTSLVKRFIQEVFSEDYHTTIGVKVDKKVVKIDQSEVSLLIWDIAGEASLDIIPDMYLTGAQGAILVFDFTREATYSSLPEQLSILKQKLNNVPIALVGNKNDLINDNQIDNIIEALNLGEILSTSAKTGEGVEHLFEILARKMIS